MGVIPSYHLHPYVLDLFTGMSLWHCTHSRHCTLCIDHTTFHILSLFSGFSLWHCTQSASHNQPHNPPHPCSVDWRHWSYSQHNMLCINQLHYSISLLTSLSYSVDKSIILCWPVYHTLLTSLIILCWQVYHTLLTSLSYCITNQQNTLWWLMRKVFNCLMIQHNLIV